MNGEVRGGCAKRGQSRAVGGNICAGPWERGGWSPQLHLSVAFR